MPRRVDRAMEPDRTEILNTDELIVLKSGTGENHYNTWYNGAVPECCPLCGCSRLKQQGKFSREYRDLITQSGHERVIRLTYNFYKYQCQNADCRHIFTHDIRFAAVNDNVTYRLQDAIARQVCGGASYANVASAFQDSLSRAAVGQIFNRWVQRRDEARSAAAPKVIALLSGEMEKDFFTLLLDCDHAEMRVLDIASGLDTDTISSLLGRINRDAVQTVLTDCNPTINDAVSTLLPGVQHIIPAGMWFGLVEEDFSHFADRHMKWVGVPHKHEVIMTPRNELVDKVKRNMILQGRPELEAAYREINRLREIIFNKEERWVLQELEDWMHSLSVPFARELHATLVQFEHYKAAIAAHQEHSQLVPDGLYRSVKELEQLIRQRRVFSSPVLRAMVLYSMPANSTPTRGDTLNDIIKNMMTLQEESRRNEEYEQ